ncbi:hypothetical protein UFOVP406_30 [uncultured Caudovirales phage]|uniref:Uncharacterized protein n=1 Tax=uncultured Caudovirales phage TaxID=2100421 RepID=A0A6J5M134_9CAUD|nr:hypothetical protein UFOVP406_30 [uncultured Caudovirales phage]
MSEERTPLELAMLAAWLNVRPDQIPAENRAQACPHTMAAWKRVGEAALEAQAAEMIEQARIIGMGAERELALRAEIERLRGLVKDALEKGRHRLLKEGFSPQDPTVRAMNEAIRALKEPRT